MRKLPKPVSVTAWPFWMCDRIAASVALITCSTCFRVRLVLVVTSVIRAVLS